jgi:hypothetical protein
MTCQYQLHSHVVISGIHDYKPNIKTHSLKIMVKMEVASPWRPFVPHALLGQKW